MCGGGPPNPAAIVNSTSANCPPLSRETAFRTISLPRNRTFFPSPGFMMTGLFVAMESSFGANGRSKCYVRAARAASATLNTAAAINMSARSLVASAH